MKCPALRIWGLVLAATCIPGRVHAQSRAPLEAAHRALRELRIEDMATALHGQTGPDADFLRGMRAFHLGQYVQAVDWMDRALVEQEDASQRELRDLVAATRDTVRGYEEARSEDGRYSIRFESGPDEAIVPYALDVLERADAVLQRELGIVVPGPIRLEIYPRTSTLAAVSTLTEENIETSGTIALCKWDRLMVTSPRALLRGYSWMDTIAHELVHLVLARASRDTAPVWVQEGIAKFLETHWRSPPSPNAASTAHLSPSSKSLLATALRDNTLLPFERLHPSIALLPSQEQAALAFAQVSSFVANYYTSHGRTALQRAVVAMAEGSDAREAFATVVGQSFASLERSWRSSLATMDNGDTEFLALAFGPEGSSLPDDAQRHLRLAEMLWARGRAGAAAAEFERALRHAPRHPLIASHLARATLAWASDGGDGESEAEAAILTLEPFVARQPDYAPLRSALAGAYSVARRNDDAKSEAIAAIRLNPFDPDPHCILADVDETTRARETQLCRELGGDGTNRPLPAPATESSSNP